MAKELTIPQRLEWLLKKRGVSQNALARVAKISPQTVANTLRHGRVPQAKTTAKFARTLGVPASVFTARTLTDDQLNRIVAAQGPWTFSEKGGASRKSTGTARKTSTARKATTGRKATTTRKATTARKSTGTARKATTARKTTGAAKKATARKSAGTARKATTARKTAAVKKTTARKPATKARKTGAVKKTTARKPATTARKSATARKATGTRTIVRHGGTAARKSTVRPAARKSTAARRPVRGTVSGGLNGSGRSIDYDAIVNKLQKLANSRSEQVALDACKALLSLR